MIKTLIGTVGVVIATSYPGVCLATISDRDFRWVKAYSLAEVNAQHPALRAHTEDMFFINRVPKEDGQEQDSSMGRLQRNDEVRIDRQGEETARRMHTGFASGLQPAAIAGNPSGIDSIGCTQLRDGV